MTIRVTKFLPFLAALEELEAMARSSELTKEDIAKFCNLIEFSHTWNFAYALSGWLQTILEEIKDKKEDAAQDAEHTS